MAGYFKLKDLLKSEQRKNKRNSWAVIKKEIFCLWKRRGCWTHLQKDNILRDWVWHSGKHQRCDLDICSLRHLIAKQTIERHINSIPNTSKSAPVYSFLFPQTQPFRRAVLPDTSEEREVIEIHRKSQKFCRRDPNHKPLSLMGHFNSYTLKI